MGVLVAVIGDVIARVAVSVGEGSGVSVAVRVGITVGARVIVGNRVAVELSFGVGDLANATATIG